MADEGRGYEMCCCKLKSRGIVHVIVNRIVSSSRPSDWIRRNSMRDDERWGSIT